ncbi:Molybdenum-pterin-binding protein MopB [Tepidimonas thermarum]|uniref:Molybdenum-pterin-binding protein MopB n=2 Tax=Tepidimonas thermarum TaxID=335431 RepID=A0A554X1J1_9BURK|nr:Molybdenum-pterin-binding protein MopB [Tepidimonas thermarum]
MHRMKPSLQVSPLEARTRFRIQVKHAVAIGPGKADVLQGIAETGSIAEAGRRLGMSYQRVWSLVQAMNRDFLAPLVHKQRGGSHGGGAMLTPLGERVLALYRDVEARAQAAVEAPLAELVALIRCDAQDGTGAPAAPAAAPVSGCAAPAGSRPE